MSCKKNHWGMDFETLKNCFTAYFQHYKDPTINYTFVICSLRNDVKALYEFFENNMDNGEYHISFNGLSFDAQISEFILRYKLRFLEMDPEDVAEEIYAEAQAVINSQTFHEQGSFRNIPEWKLSIKQIDLFKLNHFDNPARRSSLKFIQYSMDWHNMQEMPIHHSTRIQSHDELDTILKYCENDVKSTLKLYENSKSLLSVRMKVKEDYGLDCYSYSNTKMGSELLLKLYCDKTHQKRYDVKKMGTTRDKIIVKDLLFSYINFKSLDFTGFHEMLKTKVITETKDAFKYDIKFRGYTFKYGLGGLHQCIRSGIYKADDIYIIIDADVQGFYPNMAISNGMYPAHLGKAFYEVYKNDIVDVRAVEKAKGKDGNKAIVEGFKEASNASYGNSNNKYSWLYDPFYTMQTTINGQLMLTMLAEELLTSLDECQMLQINTDGMTFKIKKTDLEKYNKICSQWEITTRLKLEYAEYSSMVIRDVNNYLAIYTNGKTKCKGAFEFENLPLYKNKSFLIIPKAIYNFFVHNIPPEQTLKENKNIFDYCGAVKANGDWIFAEVDDFTCSVIKIGKDLIKNYTYKNKKDLSKIVRYYISNDGKKMLKLNKVDGRKSEVEAGTSKQTVFNQYIDKPWNEYNIDTDYYLEKIYQEIANINPKKTEQLTLDL